MALAAITGLPLCNLLFHCGCTWPLLGGDAHCDVHHAGPPDCPVCTRPAAGAAFSAGLLAGSGTAVWGAAALIGRARRRRSADA